MEDFVQHGMAHRLAEAPFEMLARAREARGERGGRQAVAGFPADRLDGPEDDGFAAPVAARGLLPHGQDRPEGYDSRPLTIMVSSE